MGEVSEPIIRCGDCGKLLAEPPNTPPEKRQPCPDCGATARRVELTISTSVVASGDVHVSRTGDVTIGAPTAGATAEAPIPEVSIGPRLEEMGYRLKWARLSVGGAWMLQVFNDGDDFIDGAIQDSPDDALLAVAERLLPPGG
jgi:hypothetical protein